MESEGTWRWNSNITWHYFCSVHNSECFYKSSPNEFLKYHHLRTQLYFAICTMESFLNAKMRNKMEDGGQSEEQIFKKLRKIGFDTKIKEWPAEIFERDFQFGKQFWEFFDKYKLVRDEITHPKVRDHSIYISLEQADPTEIRKAISGALVEFYEAEGKPWPYWLTGWNYVGFNNNHSWPFESNNLNGFYYSFRNLGFKDIGYGHGLDFERKVMMSKTSFDALSSAMDNLKQDIEPFSEFMPYKPRLTRRWWDIDFLSEDERKNRNKINLSNV